METPDKPLSATAKKTAPTFLSSLKTRCAIIISHKQKSFADPQNSENENTSATFFEFETNSIPFFLQHSSRTSLFFLRRVCLKRKMKALSKTAFSSFFGGDEGFLRCGFWRLKVGERRRLESFFVMESFSSSS